MSKKWSSFEEQQLLTENFRKWLSEEYTPPMEEASTFEKWWNKDDVPREPTEQEKAAEIEREQGKADRQDSEARSAEAAQDADNHFIAIAKNHIRWLDNELHELDPDTYDRPSGGAGELPSGERDEKRLRALKMYAKGEQKRRYKNYRSEVKEKEALIHKIKMNKKWSKEDAESKSLKGRFKKGVGKVKDLGSDVASGIGDTARKAADFAGDIKDKFFEEHGDKYSENREMIEEIIDKALANIDKKKK